MIELGNQPAMSREPHRSLFFMHLVQLGLDGLWKAIVAENKAVDLPYHNTEHLFGVAHISRDIALAEGYEPESAYIKMIITAGLIHDVNHQGSGRAPDVTNINRSIEWFEQHVASLTPLSKEHNFFVTFGERIKETIKVTEFPFVHTPKNKMEAIIRDADLLWSYQREAARIVNGNLYKEVCHGQGKAIPFEEWLAYNTKFYTTSQWFTQTGRAVAESLRASLIDLIKTNPRK